MLPKACTAPGPRRSSRELAPIRWRASGFICYALPIAAPAPVSAPAPPAQAPVDLTPLRKLLWIYLVLWTVEGALRKWILPGLANPLLVVRDPVLLLIYFMAFTRGVFPRGPFIAWIGGLATLAAVVSIMTTPTPLVVWIYGLRADFLHLPLIFLLPAVFNRDDIRAIGKWALLASPFMAVLVVLQFGSSSSSGFNAGAGGDSGMLESAYGHIRPSGTFSFTNGLSGYTLLVAAFFLHHLLEKRIYPRVIWLAAAPSLVVLIVLSGSRAAVGEAALMLTTVVFICAVQRRYLRSSFKLLALAGLTILALGSFAVFQQGLDVFTYRFVASGGVQSGFINRFFEAFTTPFTLAKDAPPGGNGLGMGTNVAAGLLVGKRTFLVAEGELARVILESGPYVGGMFLLLRFAIMFYLGWSAVGSLRRRASTLPALLFSACFIDLVQGQFSQPTALGFATIAAGLCLASNRPGRNEAIETPETARSPIPTRARGRSEYAERLHGGDLSET